MEMSYSDQASNIAAFFSNRAVLVTGATGFMGKVLVEKLLRSCPGIKTIFVLVRPKRGFDVSERLKTMLSSGLFATLVRSQPQLLQKVVAVAGDVSEVGLGLSESDRRLLQREVSVVFHSAATVRFTEKLKRAILLNVRGTQQLLELCKDMPNLESFVHVSTAFVHPSERKLEERFYTTTPEAEKLIQIFDCLEEEGCELLSPYFLRDYPNTYIFTKSITENLVQKYAGVIPAAIFRPGIVSGSLKEPVPGWLDTLNGSTGSIVAIWTGAMHAAQCNPNTCFGIVPVDLTINAIIAVSYQTALQRSGKISLYNYTPHNVNPIPSQDCHNFALSYMSKHAIDTNRNAKVFILMFTSSIFYHLWYFILQLFPAFLMDTLAFLRGNRRSMVKLQLRIYREMKNLSWGALRDDWDFPYDNVNNLFRSLNPVDQEVFNFDLAKLSWKNYLEVYLEGIKSYWRREFSSKF